MAASSTILFFIGGVYYGLSAIFDSLVLEFGWSRALISGAYSLRGIESGIFTPFVGFFVDSLGPRRILLFGLLLAGLGTVWLGTIHSLWQLYGALALMSLGLSGCGSTTLATAVAHWFVRKRSLALGLTSAGAGLSGVLVFAIALLVAAYGWRTSLVVLGTAMVLVCLPLALVVRHKPESYGYFPDGDTGPHPVSPSVIVNAHGESIPSARENAGGGEGGFTVREAAKTSAFWLLALAAVLQFTAVNSLAVHQIPFLTSVGLPAQTAALAMALTILFSLAGRVGFGWLGDRVDKKRAWAMLFFFQAVGLLIFAFIQSAWQIIPFLFLFGISYGGAIPLRGALQADYFGRNSFGAIQGLLIGIQTLFGVVGPIFVGRVFDVSGSYRPAIVALAAMAVLGLPAILSVRPPRRKGIPA